MKPVGNIYTYIVTREVVLTLRRKRALPDMTTLFAFYCCCLTVLNTYRFTPVKGVRETNPPVDVRVAPHVLADTLSLKHVVQGATLNRECPFSGNSLTTTQEGTFSSWRRVSPGRESSNKLFTRSVSGKRGE